MKRNIYLSYIHSDSMNFKFKILDRFKGRKYKISEESYDILNKDNNPSEEELLKLEKKISKSDVTVVLISRNVLESKWIPLEVQYSIDSTNLFTSETSHKGIIGVVIPDKGNDYSYLMTKGRKGIWSVDKSKLPNIISANIHNEKVVQNKNNVNYDSFISVYRWEDFIRDFEGCINAAYDKANNFSEEYEIVR